MYRTGSIVALAWLLVACDAPAPAEDAADRVDGADDVEVEAASPPVEEVASGDDETPWWAAQPRPGWTPFERIELAEDQGWFEVHRIDDATFAILEPGQWQEVISWVIEGEDKALLFDTGLGMGEIEPLVRALTDRELVVLNSHTHFDHVGGNHEFRELLGTNLPFAVANAEGRTHAQCLEDLLTEGAVQRALPPGFDPETCRTRGWSVTGYVADGDVIDLGGRSLEVMFTPGHAPDSLTLLDADRRQLFVGDTFYPAPLYAHLAGSSFDDYRVSAARLAELAGAVDLVATGHNEPVLGGEILTVLHEAFEAVAAGRPADVVSATAAVHDFGTFSIITAREQ